MPSSARASQSLTRHLRARFRPTACLGLGASLLLAVAGAACSEGDEHGTDASTVIVGTGGPGGTTGGSSPAPGASDAGGANPGVDASGGATLGGTTRLDSGAASPTGGGTLDAGGPGGGDAGAADSSVSGGDSGPADSGPVADGAIDDSGPGSNADLKTKCQSGERMGCRSVLSPSGMELELGPYGAAMDVNVGKGFENSVSLLDNNTSCASFAAQFGQSKESTDKLLDLKGLDLKLYTVYRPAKWVEGETYPVVTWGNGTCAQPEGYATLLRYVASHGFIVVAPNSRYVGSGNEQKRSLDFLFKAAQDSTSPYYKRVDTTRVAAMGHSQGSQSTINAASDARIKTVILFNVGQSAVKPFFAISGDRDIAGPLANYKSALARATKGAYMWMHMVPGNGNADGHLTLMVQPERLTGATVAWLKYMLQDDAESKTWFAGTSCKLCGHDAEYEFAAKGI